MSDRICRGAEHTGFLDGMVVKKRTIEWLIAPRYSANGWVLVFPVLITVNDQNLYQCFIGYNVRAFPSGIGSVKAFTSRNANGWLAFFHWQQKDAAMEVESLCETAEKEGCKVLPTENIGEIGADVPLEEFVSKLRSKAASHISEIGPKKGRQILIHGS